MVTAFHHIGCLVPDLTGAIANYQILHPTGEVSDVYEITEQRVSVQFFNIHGTRVEFVQPQEESSLFAMLERRTSYYHIGVFTDDIDAEIARLEKNGYRTINKFRSSAFDNRFCAFVYNNEMHMIELIEKEP